MKRKTPLHEFLTDQQCRLWAQLQAMAHVAVREAIRSGRLPDLRNATKMCVDCGKAALVYDHRDYFDQLKVDPVCLGCDKRRGPALNTLPKMGIKESKMNAIHDGWPARRSGKQYPFKRRNDNG